MDNLLAVLVGQFSQLSVIELSATLLAIGYLLFAIRQSIWCWLCAAISTAIYVYLFMQAKLYMESLLNGFYFGMAIYGWRVWKKGSGGLVELPVSVRPLSTHIVAMVMIAALSLSTGYLLERYTNAVYPYIDSMTTYSAVWATYLMIRKVLENWWYWLAVDLTSIVIYWSRELPLTSLLFVIYVLLIPFGLAAWTRSYRAPRLITATA